MGIAVVVLAIASVTADSPALGVISLALVITEREEVESFASEQAKIELDRFNRVREHLASSCKPDETGKLFYHDATGNRIRGEESVARLMEHGISLGSGCQDNPCDENCHAKL
tara:strand:+ start:304 stop:642 length:339 start_codon:yes stop_codon:yes gene_type:complete